ncbi:MAG: hypothetical protein JWO38_7592 [Gemmataceae bacterium]|nr:hypothetical protein [Gemmataceae bacterium]
MISVIFCSRVKDNPDSNVGRLLDSMVANTTPEEQEQVEFLIKYDDDDEHRPAAGAFANYPFPVRTFAWSRGEGRHALHHAQEYMFTQRDPRSRFLLMTADDFYFTRPGFVSEILNTRDEFCILGYKRPPIEAYARRYEQEAMIRDWVVSFGCWSPVVSVRLIEVCQNFGWQANVDSWLMGLSVVLYDMYGIVLWHTVPSFYERGGSYERPASVGTAPTYNNMELTNNKGPENKYWFELVRRQARNVYLNMRYGTSLKPLGWGPRRLLRKIRSQPIGQLPDRMWRRIKRDLRIAN